MRREELSTVEYSDESEVNKWCSKESVKMSEKKQLEIGRLHYKL